MKLSKKILTASLAAVILIMQLPSAMAAGGKAISDWTNLPGYTSYDGPQGTKTRAATPGVMSVTSEGINYVCDGYYKPGVEAFSGMIYKEKVNIETLSFEIILNTIPGVDSSSGGANDLWFTFAFLDKPQMFYSQSTDRGGKGLVANIRPGTRDVFNQMFTHINEEGSSAGWKTLSAATVNTKPSSGSKFSFEFKKSGNYLYLYINGKKQSNVWSNLMAKTFPDKMGYLAIATSTDTASNWSITVSKLNGVSLGDSSAAPASSTATPSTGTSSTASTGNSTGASGTTSGTASTGKTSSSGTKSGTSNVNSQASGTNSTAASGTVSDGTGTDTDPTASETDVSGDAAVTESFPEVESSMKVELKNAIKSGNSKVVVSADEGKILLKKELTVQEVLDSLELAEGYTFKIYDINNNEITDKSAKITNLNNAILYFGDSVEKVFEFTFNAEDITDPAVAVGFPWWGWALIAAGVLAVAGVLVYVLVIKKKPTGGENNA